MATTNPTDAATFGFIGIGAMGSAIARRLLATGATLFVVPGPRGTSVDILRDAGAAFVATPRDAAAKCQVVFTCLADKAAIDDVAQALLAVAKPGFCHVELSSAAPDASARLAQAYSSLGADFVDAAISGMPEQALAGDIALIAGGSPAAIARLEDVFAQISRKVVHAGAAGAGQRTKAIMSYFGMAIAASAAEVLVLGEAAGVDRSSLVSLISESGMNSATFQAMAAVANGDASARRRLTIANALKDIRTAETIADGAGLELDVLPATRAALTQAAADGSGQAFVTELTAILRQRTRPSRKN
jgi:3-hydroxyisobutyrate dehydrogenase-like beta-hydroxyacid dehydrogenase